MNKDGSTFFRNANKLDSSRVAIWITSAQNDEVAYENWQNTVAKHHFFWNPNGFRGWPAGRVIEILVICNVSVY